MKLDLNRQKIVKQEQRFKLIAVLAIIIVGLVILSAVPGMLVSALLAFVITFMSKPVVNALERRGMSRTTAILIPYLITGVAVVTLGVFFVPKVIEQSSKLQTELPKYVEGVSHLLKKHTTLITRAIQPFVQVDIGSQVSGWLQDSIASTLTGVPNWLGRFISIMILAPFFAFFMLRDGRSLIQKLLTLVPNNLFELALNLVYRINQQLGGFVRARLLEAVVVAVVVWAGLHVIDFPYAALLSVFAGVANLIPYVGPIIGAVPGLVVSLVNQDSASSVAIVGSIYMLAQVIDMLFVIPLVVARIVDLHPVTVVIVILIGGQMMGVLGMIVSVPVASIIKITFSEFYQHVVDFRN